MNKKIENKKELTKKTKKELISLAKQLKITGIYALRKNDLIDRILSNIKHKKDNITNKIQKNLSSSSQAPSSSNTKSKKNTTAKNIDKYHIPNNYQDTKITILIKDPDFIFAYWEINNKIIQTNNLDKTKLLLRVYDITNVQFNGKNANYFFDIPITLENTDWYIKVPEANRNYCIDLGYLDNKGNFHLIARSNVVNIPRSSVSENYDEEWMAVEELFRLSGGYKGQAQLSGSMEIEKMLTERLKMSISSEALITSWPLNSSDIVK